MEVRFTLWSLHDVLAKIPFDEPSDSNLVAFDFSKIDAPYYIKNNFEIEIIYDDTLLPEACCLIRRPKNKNTVTVVIIMKQMYEDAFKAWKGGNRDTRVLQQCCLRRELYSHEVSHLIAIMRAFPSDKSSQAREEFIEKIKEKFNKSVETNQDKKAVPLASKEELGKSPSVFDKDHFRYGDDNLNYFELYKELVFSYDRMIASIEPLGNIFQKKKFLTLDDVAGETFVSKNFFDIFPEKLTEFEKLLVEKLFK